MRVENFGKIPLKQVENIQLRFPKLEFHLSKDETLVLEGELDISDVEGYYRGTFEIKILVSNTFPHCVPIVYETSNIIPRDIDRHISPEGNCCLDITHVLLNMANKGINLFEFIKEKVYPFFANQLYYEEKSKFAAMEYPHDFKAVRIFYKDFLNLTNTKTIIIILERLLNGFFPIKGKGRNYPCFCGSGIKSKNCHKKEIEFLTTLGKQRLLADLRGFKYGLA